MASLPLSDGRYREVKVSGQAFSEKNHTVVQRLGVVDIKSNGGAWGQEIGMIQIPQLYSFFPSKSSHFLTYSPELLRQMGHQLVPVHTGLKVCGAPNSHPCSHAGATPASDVDCPAPPASG